MGSMGDIPTATTVRQTLPASWFRETAFYELERRAVFTKSWILVSHKTRFTENGQYVLYKMAGYSFYIIRNHQEDLKAFLNSCCHRGFPLLSGESGITDILKCNHEGRSYDLAGNAIVPPDADTNPTSDQKEDGLYRVHTHIDALGFVWINLDGSKTPQVPWDDQFGGVDTQKRLGVFNMEDYVYDHSWHLDGDFNWKTLVENYNECYHCQTAHPGIAPSINKDTKFDIEPNKCFIAHIAETEVINDVVAAPTFMFPNASLTITTHFFYLMSIVPVSATQSVMQYEVYRNLRSTAEEYQREIDFFKQVEREDKWLATAAQRNLNTDTYVSGPLHPYNERAVGYFESLIRPTVRKHVVEEKIAGKEIWPAHRAVVVESH